MSGLAHEDLQRMADHELAELVAEGITDAFDVLHRRHRGLLRTVANQYTVPGAGRADVEQEGLLGMYKACLSYRPGAGVPWAGFARVCIERNIITALKASQRRKHEVLNDARRFETPLGHEGEDSNQTLGETIAAPTSTEPSDVLERQELMERLQLLTDVLSQTELQAVRGRIDGREYSEIGRHKQVDNALQRARRKARAHLDGWL